LHCVSNDFWTLYYPHEKKGTDAMNAMGILPGFKGILCHDHWKTYYKLDCTHALCKAHYLRELTRAFEQDGQQWARKPKNLLETINCKVTDAGGALAAQESQKYRLKYRAILKQGEIECAEPIRAHKKRQKGPDQKIKIEKPVGAVKRL
jgi:transposase